MKILFSKAFKKKPPETFVSVPPNFVTQNGTEERGRGEFGRDSLEGNAGFAFARLSTRAVLIATEK